MGIYPNIHDENKYTIELPYGIFPHYDTNNRTIRSFKQELKKYVYSQDINRFYKKIDFHHLVSIKGLISTKYVLRRIIKIIFHNNIQLSLSNFYIKSDHYDSFNLYMSNSSISIEEKISTIDHLTNACDDDVGMFFENLLTIISKHIYALWERRNNYKVLTIQECFPIPRIFLLLLPLYSSGNNHFFTNLHNGHELRIDRMEDSIEVHIEISDYHYQLKFSESSFTDYEYNFNKKTILSILDLVFSPTGLHYILLILLSIEDNGRTGTVYESMQDFFSRTNKRNSQIKKQQKQHLIKVIYFFSNAEIYFRKNNSQKTLNLTFFNYTGNKTITDARKFIIHLQLKKDILRFYRSLKLAIIPKELLRENIKENHYSIFLAIYFFLKWLSTEGPIEMETGKIIDLYETRAQISNRNCKKDVLEIEDILDDFTANGYIGEWTSRTQGITYNYDSLDFVRPSCFSHKNDWVKLDFLISPPQWLRENREKKSKNRFIFHLPLPAIKIDSGEDIINIRKNLKLSQKQLAAKLKISTVQLSKYEQGERPLSLKYKKILIRLDSEKKMNK